MRMIGGGVTALLVDDDDGSTVVVVGGAVDDEVDGVRAAVPLLLFVESDADVADTPCCCARLGCNFRALSFVTTDDDDGVADAVGD